MEAAGEVTEASRSLVTLWPAACSKWPRCCTLELAALFTGYLTRFTSLHLFIQIEQGTSRGDFLLPFLWSPSLFMQQVEAVDWGSYLTWMLSSICITDWVQTDFFHINVLPTSFSVGAGEVFSLWGLGIPQASLRLRLSWTQEPAWQRPSLSDTANHLWRNGGDQVGEL